ncbi:MAG: 30S ribosomal protein S6 [Abditibacteriales bacterium]|nr:30S ribosomal protein S6 [Abditibacteriales bacterium]MDW8367044.1 30S ribosomal protein S6 [Abditibacteriales bacterium]
MTEEVIVEVAPEETPRAVETVEEAAVPEPPAKVEEPGEPSAPPAEEEAAVPAIETLPGRDYELIYILEPTLDERQVQEINGRVRSVIENGGGAIENMRVSELRRLAYPIKKRNEGLYVVINARCEPAPIREVDRVLKLEERVLRHMILRVEDI